MNEKQASPRRWYHCGLGTAVVLTPLLAIIWWQCARWPVYAPIGGNSSIGAQGLAPVMGILVRAPTIFETAIRGVQLSVAVVGLWFLGLFVIRRRRSPQAETLPPGRFQVRISFLLCVIALVAFGLAGVRFFWWTRSSTGPSGKWLELFFFASPVVTAAIVMLRGRDRVVVPMAVGFLLASGLGCSVILFGPRDIGFEQILAQVACATGSLFSVVRLLFQRFTLADMVLGAIGSFLMGVFAAAAVPNFFP